MYIISGLHMWLYRGGGHFKSVIGKRRLAEVLSHQILEFRILNMTASPVCNSFQHVCFIQEFKMLSNSNLGKNKMTYLYKNATPNQIFTLQILRMTHGQLFHHMQYHAVAVCLGNVQ